MTESTNTSSSSLPLCCGKGHRRPSVDKKWWFFPTVSPSGRSKKHKIQIQILSLSCVWLFATHVAHQVPLSVGFSGKETGVVAIPSCRGSFWPRDQTRVSCLAGGIVFINSLIQSVNAKECANYHIIALISHASNVVLKILQARLPQYVNHELPDVQAGFRKGRGTKDQITNIRYIIKKAR